MSNVNSSDISAHPVARPQHPLHNTNDPLPGAGGVPSGTDYATTMERAADLKDAGGTHVHDYDNNHTQAKPGLGDKMIGKTQKVAGKLTHNAELTEKGETREASGRLASKSI